MHKFTTLLLVALAPLALLAADKEDELPQIPLETAPITKVVAHPTWAEITRTVTIPAGHARRVRLDGLEHALIPSSLRGKGAIFVTALAQSYVQKRDDNPAIITWDLPTLEWIVPFNLGVTFFGVLNAGLKGNVPNNI